MVKTLGPGIIVAFILSMIYGATMLPDLGWEDTPEFALAIDSLGIPHSPGFPLFVLAGRCIQSTTGLSGARSATLLSAIGVILACSTIAITLRRFSPQLSIAAGLSMGLSPPVWFQATRGEVYGLHLFFATVIIALHIRRVSIRTAFFFGYVLALGVLSHPSLIVFGLLLIRMRNHRSLLMTCFGFILGISISIYLPLRSLHDPFLDWGDTEKIENFFWMISLREFAGDFSSGLLISHPSISSALSTMGAFISGAVSPALWGLAFIGTFTRLRPRWRLVVAGLSVTVFALLAGKGPDFEAYLLPVIPVIVLLAVECVSWLKIPRTLITSVWLLTLIILRYPDLHRFDRSGDTSATRYQEELAVQTHESIVFTDNTPDFFLLLHHAHMQHRAPWIVFTPYLGYSWYRSLLPDSLNRCLPESADPDFNVVKECANRCGKRALYSFSELPRGALGLLGPEGWVFHDLPYDSNRDLRYVSQCLSFPGRRGTPGAHHMAVRLGQGGQLLLSTGESPAASFRFATALQFEPENPGLWLGLCRSLLNRDRWNEAFRSLEIMAMIPHLDTELLHIIAETATDIMYRHPSRDVDEFIDSLGTLYPRDPNLHAQVLRSAILMKSPSLVIERTERYRGDSTIDILNLRGTAYLLLGEFETAGMFFREALDTCDDPEIRRRIAGNLVLSLRRRGDSARADSVAQSFGLRVQ